MDPKLSKLISKLWNDVGLQYFVKMESIYKNTDLYSECVFQIDESLPYFLDNLYRITQSNYIPSTQDVVMCRIQTTGTYLHQILCAVVLPGRTTVNPLNLKYRRVSCTLS